MKRKLQMFLLCCISVSLVACGNVDKAPVDMSESVDVVDDANEEEIEEEAKPYSLQEIEGFDVEFNTIHGLAYDGATDKLYVYADDGAYLYSGDKLYSDNTHFNLDYEINFTRAWIGTDRSEIRNLYEGENYYYVEMISGNDTSDIVVPMCNWNYEGEQTFYNKVFVNEQTQVRVYHLLSDLETLSELCVVEVPNGEHIINTVWGYYGEPLYITDQDHMYKLGIPEDDPSNTYVDKEPTISFIRDELYEILKIDYSDNLKFYNGVLVTKDNHCYRVYKND